jgi:phospholipid/cholesterol/gamma-HCH transport system permease protein
METPADFSIDREAGGRVRLTGDWTVAHIDAAAAKLEHALRDLGGKRVIDLNEVGRLDTAGAYRLIQTVRATGSVEQMEARPETQRLLSLVSEALDRERPEPKRTWSVNLMMERLGRGTIGVGREFIETMAFNGRLLVVTARAFRRPSRFRMASLTAIAERAGLDALPIIVVTNFFVGAVVGLIAVNALEDFGAQALAVVGVGIGILREFNIVITAVLLAGRSASSFAAEIGSMKMQQEIDAMQVMGVDPFEALVLPRFLALLIMTPLLTFVASVAGLAGGCIALWGAADLSPQFFMNSIVQDVGIQQFWVGMSKAPVMALVVAAIGCRQGMEVGGDVESLGRRVTAAVVHAIFSIILIDAVFALIYMELDI